MTMTMTPERTETTVNGPEFTDAAVALAAAILADAEHYRSLFVSRWDFDALDALDDLIDA